MIEGLVIDLFAGFGGASLGIRDAIGRDPDVAINHDATAVAVHAANHPATRHLQGNVWHYAPRDVTKGAPVGLLWASPTCVFFSKAKGAPLDWAEATRVRALAWVVTRWAREARPAVIAVENVEAFADWAPLQNDGRPNPKRRGQTFRRWVRSLEREGYRVEWRELRACDYGSATSRKRLFIVARCDGRPIVWPTPTHGPGTGRAHRGAHEVIDWTIPTPSIFGRARPLAEATLRRVARGIRRFVLDAAEPFIVEHYGTSTGRPARHPLSTVTASSIHQGLVVPYYRTGVAKSTSEPLPTTTTHDRFGLATPYLIPCSHAGDDRVHGIDEPVRTVTASSRSPFQLVAPALVHVSNGERPGQAPRIYDPTQPLNTVVAGGIKQGLVAATLVKNYGGHEGSGLSPRSPLGTATTRDHHGLVTCETIGDRRDEVRDLLRRYGPAPTTGQRSLFARDDMAVRIGGTTYEIADVGMRLLVPRELGRSHSFGDELALERDVHGRPVTKTAQVRLVGNSVPRDLARAVAGANVGVHRDAVQEAS